LKDETIPLITFRGYLRCHRPIVLTPVGRQIMTDFFPNFANPSITEMVEKYEEQEKLGTATDEQRRALERAKELLNAGVRVETRRHRRYAGGDGLLPRGRYFSVCKNEGGSDGGTMCRELFEYRNKTFPGTIFVGDSTDKELFASLNIKISFKPGYSGFCVMALPPQNPAEIEQWVQKYERSLQMIHGQVIPRAFVTVIETEYEFVDIENVLDLRLPTAQLWLHEKFTGNAAAPWYSKVTPTRPKYFVGMLPSLMEYEYGGCELTHGIGGWLRAHSVNGLIFPSARSNAGTLAVNGRVMDFHGWNFVDYRNSPAVNELVIDASPWKDFTPPTSLAVGRGFELSLMEWFVTGIEDDYTSLRNQIIDANKQYESEPRESDPSTSQKEERSPALERMFKLALAGFEKGGERWYMKRKTPDKLEVEIVCIICGAESTWFPRDEHPPAECYNCHTR
jgi:hypothetical protein